MLALHLFLLLIFYSYYWSSFLEYVALLSFSLDNELNFFPSSISLPVLAYLLTPFSSFTPSPFSLIVITEPLSIVIPLIVFFYLWGFIFLFCPFFFSFSPKDNPVPASPLSPFPTFTPFSHCLLSPLQNTNSYISSFFPQTFLLRYFSNKSQSLSQTFKSSHSHRVLY